MANDQRARARDLGVVVGLLPPGPNNAITDVEGVRVGHTTLIQGDGPLRAGKGPVRTGVTVVAAETMVGRDGITAYALPHDRLREAVGAA